MVLETLVSIFTPMLEGLGEADDYNRCHFIMLKQPSFVSPFVLDTSLRFIWFVAGRVRVGTLC